MWNYRDVFLVPLKVIVIGCSQYKFLKNRHHNLFGDHEKSQKIVEIYFFLNKPYYIKIAIPDNAYCYVRFGIMPENKL